MRKINKVYTHHSGSPRDTTSVGMIKKWHKEKGFPHIGYHFILPNDGKIKNTLTINRSGYHAYDEKNNIDGNKDSIGICLTGNFMIEFPSNAQIYSLISLLKKLLTRFPHLDIDDDILGHSDFEPTKCPGKNLYNEFLRIKGELKRWRKENLDIEETKPEVVTEKKEIGAEMTITIEKQPNKLERIMLWIKNIIKKLIKK